MAGRPEGYDRARPIGRKLAKAIYELNFIRDKLTIDGHTLDLAESRKLPHRNSPCGLPNRSNCEPLRLSGPLLRSFTRNEPLG